VWRRSRGADPVPRPAASVILRNSRRTLAASKGVPTAEAARRQACVTVMVAVTWPELSEVLPL